jgi:excisionase family DNA binding protein
MAVPLVREERSFRQPAMANEGEILTVKEVCDLLGAHPSTVYRLARQDKIPSFKIGQEWRFRKDLIMRWIAEQTKGPRQ